MADTAKKDQNSVATLLGTSSSDGTPVAVYADPVTHRLLVDATGTGGSGITSINADTTAAQILAAGTNVTITDNGTGTHTISATGGSGTPGGLNTQIQYNNAGAFGGITGAVTDGTAVSLTAAHLLNPTINGAGTGLATLAYPNTSSSATITLPTVTGTLATLAGTETFTNKTFTAPTITGATITTSTVNGVTLTTGGGTTTFLNANGTYSTPAGTGTVTSVSIVPANGFAGTVATATSTPAITLTTSITGVLKGNGTTISAATSGTDYSAGTSALTTGILKSTTTTGVLSIAVAADFPTLNQNTSGSAATLTTTRTIGILTGDATSAGSTFDGSANNTNALTLATVNTNVGSFTNANITVNAKGLITAASNGSAGSGITIGTTTITSGTSGRVLYDNAGVVGELTVTGTGTTAVLSTSPVITTPTATLADSGTINTPNVLTVSHTSSGTAGVGFGAAIAFSGQDATGTTGNIAVISAQETSASAGAITSKLVFTIDNSGMLTTQMQYQVGSLSAAASPDLGITSTSPWGNVFLASGKKIDFGNGNVVLTQSTGILTVGTGDLQITTAGTASASVVTVGGTQTLTNKTLTTPILNGIPTGTGVATAATASTIVLRDANANSFFNNIGLGYLETASGGTPTLTNASAYYQVSTGAGGVTYTLPVASTMSVGQSFLFKSNSVSLTVNSSGANLVATIANGARATITCILASGTTAASWRVNYDAVIVTDGKKLSVSNSLTLAGTDSTTLTFPTTSATIARTDAAQTFTGVQTLSSSPVLSTNAITGSGANTVTLFTSSDTVVGRATTDTLTNKRINPRVVSTTQSATPAINTDNGDIFEIVGLAQAITSITLTGTPVEGQMFEMIIKDNGTARAIALGSSFVSSTVTIPTTTVISTPIAILFQWRSSAVWTATSAFYCIAVA